MSHLPQPQPQSSISVPETAPLSSEKVAPTFVPGQDPPQPPTAAPSMNSGSQPPQQQPASVLTEDNPIPDPMLLESPVFIYCPNCKYTGATAVRKKPGVLSLICFICCLDCMKDTEHYCPQCRTVMGTYQAL